MRKICMRWIACVFALAFFTPAHARIEGGASFYAAPSGVNTNDCLSASTPCQLDYILASWRDGNDAKGQQITINLACGNYTTSGIDGPLFGINRPEQFLISGPSSNRTCAVLANGFTADHGARLKLTYLRTSGSLVSVGGGELWIGRVDFAAMSVHMGCGPGGRTWAVDPYTVSGGASHAHWNAAGPCQMKALSPPAGETMVTFTGSPNFAGYFALADEAGAIVNFAGVTFTGAVTVYKQCGASFGGLVYGNPTVLPTASSTSDIVGWGGCP